MKTKKEYYLGITLCFIIGAIITPFYGVFITILRLAGAIITPLYGVFITILRLAHCLWGIAYDTFFFIPTMASAYHYKFWEKQVESEEENNHLN